MEIKTTYFDNFGPENTEATLRLARQRAKELDIKTLLVPSISGKTGVKAMAILDEFKVIIVSHSYGLNAPNTNNFTEENRKTIENKGGKILTATHVFGGITSALSKDERPGMHLSYVTGDIITMTLRMFGDGLKVACEIATMAADAGLVRTDEEVIALGGQHGGVDTAVVLMPNYSHRFFNTRVKEIVCKPRL
jgi:uncharacterized protein